MIAIKDKIRTVPNWPIKGVMFRDITTILQDPEAFKATCDIFYNRYKNMAIDKIVAIDARGFIFGAVLAYHMGVSLIPVRKKGKLPYKTISESYTLEYGENSVELHDDSIQQGDKVLVIDDLIATGGTIMAAIKLVERLGGKVVECAFIVELPELKGREKIKNYPIFAITEFEGE
ncbi:MAG: adenine phosphoribosyltransferase [Desulfobacterales bacterium]|nr:adenine phosphoribosyltransferase [Desulfobacterales bacterium]